LSKYQNFKESMVKCLIETMVFLEFTSEELLNPDVAIEMQESISFELGKLSHDEKCELKEMLELISLEYTDNKITQYIKSLPSSLGIS